MKYIVQKISFLEKENYYAKIAALFRVGLCIVLIFDVFFHFSSIHDFYSNDSWFISYNQNAFVQFLRNYNYLFFSVYLITLFMYLLGVGKHFVALLFFILYTIKMMIAPEVLTWGDSILRISLFYMVFVDAYAYLAINKSIQKENTTSNMISNLGVYLIILNICLVYFDNGLYKIFERDWQNGQAFYFAVEHVRIYGTPFNHIISNNVYISAFSTYITLISQLFFIPLLFYKRTKGLIVFITICFHVLVAVFFFLYKFQAIMILLHLFFFTDKELNKNLFISKWLKNS